MPIDCTSISKTISIANIGKKKTKRAIIVGPSASAVEHFHYSGRITDDDYMFECAVSMNRKLYAIEGILPTSTDLNYLCLLVIAS